MKSRALLNFELKTFVSFRASTTKLLLLSDLFLVRENLSQGDESIVLISESSTF